MDAARTAEILVFEGREETRFLEQVSAQAVRNSTPLFVTRFLADLGPGDLAPEFMSSPWITLRQYGGSCFVNAPSPLADALRAETGLAEAEAAARSERYPIVVLSQILDAVGDGLLASEDLARLVDGCPPHLRLILTGHSLPPAVAATPCLTACLAVHAPISH